MKTAKEKLWEVIQAIDPEHKANEFEVLLNENSAEGQFIRAFIIAMNEYALQLADVAFVAGRSQTSWEQFKKDHNIQSRD